MTIISHADLYGGVPRIDGYDVTVLDVYHAHASGLEPAEVADEFDIPLARTHEALAFYFDHLELMRKFEDEVEIEEMPDLGRDPLPRENKNFLSENQTADEL